MRELGQDKNPMETGALKKNILKKKTENSRSAYTCALQHLAFSERVASVGKKLSVALPVIPGGKLWKTGVGTGPLEPINWRKSFLGDARHFGYVVMAAKTNRVPMSRL